MLPLSRVSGGNCESKVGARRLEEVLLAPHVGGKHGRPVVHAPGAGARVQRGKCCQTGP